MAHSYINCSCCDKKVDLEDYCINSSPIGFSMVKNRLCFDCAYWKTQVEHRDPDTIVVNGSIYHHPSPLKPVTQTNLYHLRRCYFLFDPKTRDCFAASKLTIRGKIPSNFKEAIPDDFVFVTKEVCKTIMSFEAEFCLSKGCMDRYHCYWYNAQLAEPDGPWNKISPKHIVGSEECPSFIDKNNL